MSRRKTHAQESAAEQPEAGSALAAAESGPAENGDAGRDGMAGADPAGDARGIAAGSDGTGGIALDPAGASLADAGTGASGPQPGEYPAHEAAALADVAGAADPVVTIDPVADGIDADDAEPICIACGEKIEDGDPVYNDMDGGFIHAECCGPGRESYTGPDGEPLADGDPIPEPWIWHAKTETVDPVADGIDADGTAGPDAGHAADALAYLLAGLQANPAGTIDPVAEGIDADDDDAEPNLHPSLVRVMCAVEAAGWAARPFIDDPDMYHDFGSRLFTPKAIDDLKALIRQIGDRATPAVLGQQLFLKGHRDNGTLEPLETVVLDIFSHVLRRLDAHQALILETARKAAADLAKPAPVPVPIEDTTLEPIDGAFDTW